MMVKKSVNMFSMKEFSECVLAFSEYVDNETVGDFQLHKIYRSGTVNSKSFVGKVFLQIKWTFELNYVL